MGTEFEHWTSIELFFLANIKYWIVYMSKGGFNPFFCFFIFYFSISSFHIEFFSFIIILDSFFFVGYIWETHDMMGIFLHVFDN